jgi:hypothetical protein
MQLAQLGLCTTNGAGLRRAGARLRTGRCRSSAPCADDLSPHNPMMDRLDVALMAESIHSTARGTSRANAR